MSDKNYTETQKFPVKNNVGIKGSFVKKSINRTKDAYSSKMLFKTNHIKLNKNLELSQAHKEKGKNLFENKILLESLVSKIKFNIKYKLINFLYISKALFRASNFKQKNNDLKKFVNFYLYYSKLLFSLKYIFFFKVILKNKEKNNTKINLNDFFFSISSFLNIILQISNLTLSTSSKKIDLIFNNKLNFFLINLKKENLTILPNPSSYLSYDLNYYDFISQTDINQNIKEQQFLIKKKKKLAKGTGFLFLPEKFLNKLSPQKKKLLTSYILQQQKRKKHEIYGYLSPLETKPLVAKGFIRPRKKMKKLGILYYRPTRRNLKMTFVDASGQVLAYYSCGTNKKFKKARRRLKDVRERTLFKMTVQIDDLKYKRVIVAFKGSQFVKVFKVLKRRRLKIIGYSFDTLIPHNGCRKPKKKRK